MTPALNRKTVPSCSPGLAPRPTLGSQTKMIIQPQGGCVISFVESKNGATALRLRPQTNPYPGYPKRPTLGWRLNRLAVWYQAKQVITVSRIHFAL